MLSDESLVSATILDRKASLSGAPRAAEIAAARTAFSVATLSASVPDVAFAITDIKNELGRDAPNSSILRKPRLERLNSVSRLIYHSFLGAVRTAY
jgi:hypothetical protein